MAAPRPEWHHVVRIAWLSGGVAAINEPGPHVLINLGANGRSVWGFRLNKYGGLFEALRNRGFIVIGTTFITDQDEVDGVRQPEFRAAAVQGGWRVWNVWQQWRQIAVAASTSDQMTVMDIASRIASALLYSQMRLGDLAGAYSAQLRSWLHRNTPTEYQAFTDMNSFEVYKAIHALFWQMAVLRDTLAEFTGSFCLLRAKITSLNGLIKSLRKTPSAVPIAHLFVTASEPRNGWLARFSNYRNFFTHAAPMEQAAGRAFAIQDLRALPTGLVIPQIYYALPANIDELLRARTRGTPFSSLKQLAAAASRRRERSVEPDALEYLHGCLDSFVNLADALIASSPIAPKPMAITRADMRGEIKVIWRGVV